ncbi:MAG: molybdopterin converting factor subunit 1 [Pseudomonadota bacterium]
MKVLYFAWVRERIGVPGEEVTTSATTVSELIDELSAREERYASAFADLTAVRVAVDQTLVPLDTSIENAREVAFFPPMTGG